MKALLRLELWLFPGTILLFLLWPELDLKISRFFWQPEQGFVLRDAGWVRFTYELFAQLPRVLAVVLLLAWLGSYLHERIRAQRPLLGFLLFSLVLGPGLIVNEGFKAHYDRARPSQIRQFGGEKQFTPALQPADQCRRNCSFVSGHAAGAFWLMALAWLFGRRRWLVPGIVLGLFVGLVRIVQGGHFFSDVLFAGWVVWFTLRLCARLWLGRWSITPATKQNG